jgi:hypothetical protein
VTVPFPVRAHASFRNPFFTHCKLLNPVSISTISWVLSPRQAWFLQVDQLFMHIGRLHAAGASSMGLRREWGLEFWGFSLQLAVLHTHRSCRCSSRERDEADGDKEATQKARSASALISRSGAVSWAMHINQLKNPHDQRYMSSVASPGVTGWLMAVAHLVFDGPHWCLLENQHWTTVHWPGDGLRIRNHGMITWHKDHRPDHHGKCLSRSPIKIYAAQSMQGTNHTHILLIEFFFLLLLLHFSMHAHRLMHVIKFKRETQELV